MGSVAFNTHMAFWAMDDSITQVKMLGKNAQTFFVCTKLIAGVNYLFYCSIKSLNFLTFLVTFLSHLLMPVSNSLLIYKIIRAPCKINNS